MKGDLDAFERELLRAYRGYHRPTTGLRRRVRARLLRRDRSYRYVAIAAAAALVIVVFGTIQSPSRLEAVTLGEDQVQSLDQALPPEGTEHRSWEEPTEEMPRSDGPPSATLTPAQPHPPVGLKPAPSPSQRPSRLARPHSRTSTQAEDHETLAEETRRIRDVQLTIKAGQMTEALRHLAEYRGRFPEGRLRTEAQALEAIAACAIDRARGQELARKFMAAHPRSPAAGRVGSNCFPASP